MEGCAIRSIGWVAGWLGGDSSVYGASSVYGDRQGLHSLWKECRQLTPQPPLQGVPVPGSSCSCGEWVKDGHSPRSTVLPCPNSIPNANPAGGGPWPGVGWGKASLPEKFKLLLREPTPQEGREPRRGWGKLFSAPAVQGSQELVARV